MATRTQTVTPTPDQPASGPRFWIGVVSRAHVQRGVAAGIAQLGHGKAAPLRRMHEGDWLIYYSPRDEVSAGEPVQAFTAIGRLVDDDVYQVTVSESFSPFRRAITYLPSHEAPIKPLLERLSFIKNPERWGSVFRFGHLEISRDDFAAIAAAMGADPAVELGNG